MPCHPAYTLCCLLVGCWRFLTLRTQNARRRREASCVTRHIVVVFVVCMGERSGRLLLIKERNSIAQRSLELHTISTQCMTMSQSIYVRTLESATCPSVMWIKFVLTERGWGQNMRNISAEFLCCFLCSSMCVFVASKLSREAAKNRGEK